jgi:hypothetical protein
MNAPAPRPLCVSKSVQTPLDRTRVHAIRATTYNLAEFAVVCISNAARAVTDMSNKCNLLQFLFETGELDVQYLWIVLTSDELAYNSTLILFCHVVCWIEVTIGIKTNF